MWVEETFPCLQVLLLFCLKKHHHTCLPLRKKNPGKSSYPSWKNSHRKTNCLCDWVINHRGAVVLPRDRAIDSGRGCALGFDWPRRSGSSWEAAECLSRQIRADVSSPLSRNHLPSSLRPVFVFSRSHTGKHTQTSTMFSDQPPHG